MFQQPQIQASPTQQLVQVQSPMQSHQQAQIATSQQMQGIQIENKTNQFSIELTSQFECFFS